ncbi:MAG: hypothetical protein RL360_943 [Bacteroidota bacterium]|jgi:hypothetical protein
MKKNTLLDQGLIELSSKELIEYEGGNWLRTIATLFVSFYDAFNDFMEGFNEAQLKKNHTDCK